MSEKRGTIIIAGVIVALVIVAVALVAILPALAMSGGESERESARKTRR